jgi:hypothetical protein
MLITILITEALKIREGAVYSSNRNQLRTIDVAGFLSWKTWHQILAQLQNSFRIAVQKFATGCISAWGEEVAEFRTDYNKIDASL